VNAIAADLRLRLAPRALPLGWLAAPALLGLGRLLPADGFGLGVRLAGATACLLLPGAVLARALRLYGLAPAFVASLTALFAGMAIMFAVHGSLWLAFAVMFGAGACAIPFALRQSGSRISAWSLGVGAFGLAAGISLWSVAAFGGDAFFHIGRVRKLVDFGSISLRSLDEFRDGGLHPGYAFPLWHGFMALMTKLAGVDPDAAVLHAPTVLLPLSFVLVYEAGTILFRSRWAGVATVLLQFALLGLAPGHGGSLISLGLAANASRMLLFPALLAVVFAYVREPSGPGLAAIAAAAGALSLTHPPHAALVVIVLAGFLVARALLARQDVKTLVAALAAVIVPAAAVALWLLPVVRETTAHNPGAGELHRAFANYRNELDVFGLHSYRLKPELFGRAGAVSVAAIALLPFAVFARRRLWAAFALGGMLAAYAVALLTFVFPHFADAVSLSQARRIVGFSPREIALVGAALVLARVLGVFVLPVGLAAGIALQLAFPGDFERPFRHAQGAPGWLTWASFGLAAAALVVGVFGARRLPELERPGLLAAGAVALFVLPVAVHGYTHWGTRAGARQTLAPSLVQALRARIPERAVVFSDALTAYKLAAELPVYVNATPPIHSSDTKANHPAARVHDEVRFFRTGRPLSMLRRYGAGWLLVDRQSVPHKSFPLPQAYSDGRYVLYRVP
jgi:6-pyruvoyl-tetrahydropterin synthase-like protein